jgi:hypothetical protein
MAGMYVGVRYIQIHSFGVVKDKVKVKGGFPFLLEKIENLYTYLNR